MGKSECKMSDITITFHTKRHKYAIDGVEIDMDKLARDYAKRPEEPKELLEVIPEWLEDYVDRKGLAKDILKWVMERIPTIRGIKLSPGIEQTFTLEDIKKAIGYEEKN